MKLTSILIIIFLPIIIFCTNFLLLTLNKNVYFKIFEQIGTYYSFNTQEEVTYLTNNLLGYFRGENLLEQNFFSTQAVLHLSDVKNLIQLVKLLNVIFLISVIILLAFLILSKKFERVAESIFKGAILTVIFTFLIFALFLFNFNFAFEKLHLILFRNNLWLFSQNDNLFKLFPESFFVNFAIILAINIIITAFSMFVLSQVIKNND